MKQPNDINETIAVPIPQYITRGTGQNSTEHARPLRYRVTSIERDMILRAAEACDCTVGNFSRWCAYWVAKRVIELDAKEKEEA